MIKLSKAIGCDVIEGELVRINYYGLCGKKITPVTIYYVTERDYVLSRNSIYYLIWGVKFYELPKEVKLKRLLFSSRKTITYRA